MDEYLDKPPIYYKALSMLSERPWWDRYKNLIWFVLILLPFLASGVMAYTTAMENKRDIMQLRDEMKAVKEFIAAQKVMNSKLDEKINGIAIDVRDIRDYLMKRK